jgi:hypothetical protein
MSDGGAPDCLRGYVVGDVCAHSFISRLLSQGWNTSHHEVGELDIKPTLTFSHNGHAEADAGLEFPYFRDLSQPPVD